MIAEESLLKIPKIVEESLEIARTRTTLITRKHKQALEKLNSNRLTVLQRLELKLKEKLVGLEKTASGYRKIEVSLEGKEEELRMLKKDVESKFGFNFSKAYSAIKKYEGMDFMKGAEEVLKQLNTQLKEIELIDIDAREDNKLEELVCSVKYLKHQFKAIKDTVMTDIFKNDFTERINKKKIEIENKRKQETKQIEERRNKLAEEINVLSNQNSELLNTLRTLNEQIEKAKEEKEQLLNLINNRREELKSLEQELTDLKDTKEKINKEMQDQTNIMNTMKRNFEDMADLNSELGLDEVNRQLVLKRSELEEMQTEIKAVIKNGMKNIELSKEDIQYNKNKLNDQTNELIESIKAKRTFNLDFKKWNKAFELITTQVHVIKDSKKYFDSLTKSIVNLKHKEKSYVNQLQMKRLSLEIVHNDLSAMKSNTKQSLIEENKQELHMVESRMNDVEDYLLENITNMQQELKKLIPLEKEFNDDMEVSIPKLMDIKKYLEEQLKLICPICADGRAGKVRLKCGHYMCVSCIAKQKLAELTKSNLIDNNEIAYCVLCRWEKREIDYVLLKCGCRQSPKLPHEARLENDSLVNVCCNSCKTEYDVSDTLALWGGIGIKLCTLL
jgi:myosin heavy subunit